MAKICGDLELEESKQENWDGISKITLTDI
jgi:hypothetical protein